MEYDTKRSLASIRYKSSGPLSSVLVKIQAHQRANKKSGWIKNLECLKSTELPNKECLKSKGRLITAQEHKFLERKTINPFKNRKFVAVSCAWEPSSTSPTDIATGGYYIKSRTSKDLNPSEVRDIVLDRIIEYTKHCRGTGVFWIDKECIDQDDRGLQHEAMQNMHWVYGLSKFPVGLLSLCVESPEEIDLLTTILEGGFTTSECRELSQGSGSGKLREALDLLRSIVSDKWWDRAWIFQEEYCSTTRMKLLIPHHKSLEGQKRNAGATLGNIPGEICFRAVDFRKQATKFCLSYERIQPQQGKLCCWIIQRVARYTHILKKSRAMSPYIYSEIGNRGITIPSDILTIAANCCNYSTYLEPTLLRERC
ncbi:hypothetical protein BGZ60DRAFT_404043 [Tricladium varicosporioides]|nr:hypothetical protein BGZ60DRAFT_404043 [Hymenoscyphus varicosporioides]